MVKPNGLLVTVSGIAKYAALDTTDGQWLRRAEKPGAIPLGEREFAVLEAPEARMYWDSSVRGWRVNVESPGAVFLEPGNYQFEPGKAGLQKDLAGITSPFEWLRPLPGLTPDFEREFRPSEDLKEIRNLPDGSAEIRYYFHQIDLAAHGPLIGAFVVHTDGTGKKESFRLESSLPEVCYERARNNPGALSYWSPISVLPKQAAAFTWVSGDAPTDIATHIREHWSGTEPRIDADYTNEPATGQFFLRVSVGSSSGSRTYVFNAATTEAEVSRLLQAKRNDRDVYAALPPGIPEKLIASLPSLLNDPGTFAKLANGTWGRRELSEKGLEAELRRIIAGGAIVLDSGITRHVIEQSFQERGKPLVCKENDRDNRIVYGGLIFSSCLALNSLAVLEALEDGEFSDPESGMNARLSAGQIIMVEKSDKVCRSAFHSIARASVAREPILWKLTCTQR